MPNQKDAQTELPPMGLTPILTTKDAAASIAFYKRAFEAVELTRISAPDGQRILHARLEVHGSPIVVMDDFPELDPRCLSRLPKESSPVTLHLQVRDANTTWKRAMDAGATEIIPLAEVFWGELYGRCRDPFGHEWTVAQWLGLVASDQVEKLAATMFERA